ncbi:alpha/beta fold hydrolase [Geomonas subterranea]|uniref:Alpha/beta fold hydrolase n=1 Tax=Geomonas subterranea TaxID=2847989 RepID=A0ABX8LG34_9BACT|nr:alpha/beta fold hydrolase [Geomonas subterranea]QXE90673.1 alpha/beta fold hydrolase [Geomonas subterranea]QXM11246.1 alpha/beta fold hydrolase [Geomonas subterranea]
MTLHFQETGAGRPVVFVHGWAMSGRAWRFQQELGDAGRLIFLDLRGHGHSPPAGSYTIEDYASDLAGFFEELALRDAVLVGWSMGVQVALQAFPALRTRLAGMVLVGGNARYSSCDDYPHGKAPVEVKGMGLRLRRDHQKTMGDFFKGMFAEGELDHTLYQRIVHEIVMGGRSADREAVMQSLNILSTADLREQLPQVDRPVLVIHGEQDTVCTAAASTYLAQHLPMARLEIFEGCGHAPFMSRPERFNEVVREFIAGL